MLYELNKLGIILEFKNIDKSSTKDLKEVANGAIKQIDEKRYHAALLQHNIKRCLKVGIAFRGKELAMSHRIEDVLWP